MLLLDVSLEFDRKLRQLLEKEPEDIRNAVLNHEKRKLVLNSACNEVLKYEKAFRTKLESVKRQMIIHAVAQMFCELAIKSIKQKALSDACKSVLIKEQNRLKDLKEEISHGVVETGEKHREGPQCPQDSQLSISPSTRSN